MVRNLAPNDFVDDSGTIMLLAGQSALVVLDKKLAAEGRDPVVCSVIGNDDEIQVLYRVYKTDPSDLDIKYVTSETDPNVLVGVFDMHDFRTMMANKLKDVFEFEVFLGKDFTLEDQLHYLYTCLFVEGIVDPQLVVYNRAPKEYREGYIAPADLFALFFGAEYPIGTYEEFLEAYREQQSIATFVGDMPVDGKKTRVVVSLYPPREEGAAGEMLISLPGAKTEDEARAYLDQFMDSVDETILP